MSTVHFGIRRDTLYKLPLLLIGARERTCFVELADDELRLAFGRYRERFAYGDIVDIEPVDWKGRWGIGVRYVPGDMIGYVGSPKSVVSFGLREMRDFKVLVTLRAKRIAVSLDDPGGFTAALRERIGT